MPNRDSAAGTVITSARHLQAGHLVELRDHWLRLKGDLPWPRRESLRPADFRRHLAHVFIIDVVDGGRDFYHRLAGEAVVQAHSYNIVRTHVSTADYGSEEKREIVLNFYRSIVTRGDPVRLTGTLDFLNRDFIAFETVYLPFSSDGTAVDVIFGASDFRSRFARKAKPL